MIKRKKWLPIIILASLVLLTSISSAWASEPKFNDITENHWARQSIEEMNAAGVIGGYPDGSFKPNDSISRLHTIFMLVRVKNLESKVNSYDLSSCNYTFPPEITDETQKKHLAVAVDEGWLLADGLKVFGPKANATRQEVASLVAIAFNIRGNESKLPFTDKNEITPGLLSYIAGVYEKGIMTGRTATTFDPQSPVKRSELAAVFSRMVDQGIANPNPNKKIEGYITDVETNYKQIIVRKGNGGLTYTYPLNDDTPVYKGDAIASLSDIKTTDPVRIYLDNNNKVTYIKTISNIVNSGNNIPAPSTGSNDQTNDNKVSEVVGYVKDLTTNQIEIKTLDGKTKKYELSNDISLLKITKDDFVTLKLKGNVVTKYEVMEDISTYTGTIIDIDDDEITVARSISTDKDFDVDEDTIKVVDEDDDAIDYDDLKIGYTVEVTYTDKDALKIKLLSEKIGAITGTIYKLSNNKKDEDDWELEILNVYGDRVEYEVDEDVDVYDEDGKRMEFYELDQSDRDEVILYLDKKERVEKILLAKVKEGIIDDLDDDEIKVDRDYYDLDIDIDQYIIGSKVKVYIHDGEVMAIEVIEDYDGIEVPGEIYSIDDDDLEITIKQASGNKFTFDVDKKVNIDDEEDDDDLDFDDLKKGWDVILELEDGVVEDIIVTNK
ncbi:S-layer homology domain-containing protein [Peptococcaceae bacterium 1198_IL3148]